MKWEQTEDLSEKEPPNRNSEKEGVAWECLCVQGLERQGVTMWLSGGNDGKGKQPKTKQSGGRVYSTVCTISSVLRDMLVLEL